MNLQPLPLSPALMERYRLESRRRNRPDLVGGHLMRRKGQSLDFRDYEHYMPGDDIRHVDWRASARYGLRDDLLVRSFAAEEQLTLVISLDNRPTMALPEHMTKAQMAAWLAEAVASIALRSGDRVVLHRLFGKTSGSMIDLRGSQAHGRIRPNLAKFIQYGQEHPEASINLKAVKSYLPPTAVWLVLTDFYFPAGDNFRKLARFVASANDGMRWVIMVDFNSWPMEEAYLGTGARRIEGPGFQAANPEFELTLQSLNHVTQKIKHHKQNFFNTAGRTHFDLVDWSWPREWDTDPSLYFKQRFLHDPIIQRLFMRDSR